MISIAILDDHPIVAEGIRRLVEDTPDIVVEGFATNFQDLERILKGKHFDLIIVDVNIAGENVENTCKHLRSRHAQSKILILSSFFDHMILRKTLAAGASGYALKTIGLQDLPAAIRVIVDGGVYIPPELAKEAILFQLSPPTAKDMSGREEAIVQLISNGMTNKEIAQVIGVSSHTVKLHVARLLKRFNYKSRSQLAHHPNQVDAQRV